MARTCTCITDDQQTPAKRCPDVNPSWKEKTWPTLNHLEKNSTSWAAKSRLQPWPSTTSGKGQSEMEEICCGLMSHQGRRGLVRWGGILYLHPPNKFKIYNMTLRSFFLCLKERLIEGRKGNFKTSN